MACINGIAINDKHYKMKENIMNVFSSVSSTWIILFWIVVTTAEHDMTTESPPIIIPSFFDFKKEIENIFPDVSDHEVSTIEPKYELETGVTLERDYDFYADDIQNFDDYEDNYDDDDDNYGSDDADMSGSAQVTVRSGYFPSLSKSR